MLAQLDAQANSIVNRMGLSGIGALFNAPAFWLSKYESNNSLRSEELIRLLTSGTLCFAKKNSKPVDNVITDSTELYKQHGGEEFNIMVINAYGGKKLVLQETAYDKNGIPIDQTIRRSNNNTGIQTVYDRPEDGSSVTAAEGSSVKGIEIAFMQDMLFFGQSKAFDPLRRRHCYNTMIKLYNHYLETEIEFDYNFLDKKGINWKDQQGSLFDLRYSELLQTTNVELVSKHIMGDDDAEVPTVWEVVEKLIKSGD